MSHNGNFRMGAPMSGAKRLGAAYAPDAQGSAEGDILDGLREDDADVRLRGLREDDADVRLQGLREDDADVRLQGLREDDADVRLRGLREDDADVRLRGLREDDADVRLRGLREDDAAVRMGDVDSLNAEAGRIEQEQMAGLREDDAAVRMGDTRWDGATGSAEGSSEGHRDAQLGRDSLGVSAYDRQPEVLTTDGRRGGMGTAY
ncbi:MAG: hypothetical protein ACREDF_01660, partial [Thermoplasmata archaeon]